MLSQQVLRFQGWVEVDNLTVRESSHEDLTVNGSHVVSVEVQEDHFTSGELQCVTSIVRAQVLPFVDSGELH